MALGATCADTTADAGARLGIGQTEPDASERARDRELRLHAAEKQLPGLES